MIRSINKRLSNMDDQFGIVALTVFILIIITNIITLVFNANRLQDKDDLKDGRFTNERERFNTINSIFVVGIPFVVWFIIWVMFRYNGGKGLYMISEKTTNFNRLSVLRYQSFWIPLTMAIVFLIFSNFINSLRNVKTVETDEDESIAVSGLIVSFISFGVFMGFITYIVTN